MYKQILKNPIVLKLSFVQFLIYFGSWFSMVAIYTMVLNFKVPPVQNSLVATMFYLPAMLGVINGAVVDKFELKKFMSFVIAFELVFTSLFLSITSREQVYLLMFFIFLRTTCSFLFFTAQMSLFPTITKDDKQLQTVNELHSIIWSVTFALGMSLGGIVVKLIGVYHTIMIDIGLFAIALLIFLSIKLPKTKKQLHSIKKLIVDGFFYITRHKTLPFLILLHSSVALTSFDTIVNLLTDSYYKNIIAISLSIGFINGARAFGLMIGPFFLSKLVSKQNLYLLLFTQGAVIMIWSFFQKDFYASLFFIFFIGFFTTTLWSFTYTLIQKNTKKRYLGRVVAYNDMVFMFVTVMINFLSGYLYQKGISLGSWSFTLGVGFLIFGLVSYRKFSISYFYKSTNPLD